MALSSECVVLVDWLNLSIKLKSRGREFGPSIVRTIMDTAKREADASGNTLARVHFVAENFGQGVERIIKQNL